MKLNDQLNKAQSHLETLDGNKLSNINFIWRDIEFHAIAKERANGTGKIELTASLGRLFYTAENAKARTQAINTLFATNPKIDGRYSIEKKGDILFTCVTETRKLVESSTIFSALTLILLETSSHLLALKANLKPIP